MSIIEIVNRTGISKATVYRALNKGIVSENKRYLIEQAIKDIGYEVPKVRRAPRKNSKTVIGLFFLADDFNLLQNLETSYPVILNSLIKADLDDTIEVSPNFFTTSSFDRENLDKYGGFIVFGPSPKDKKLPNSLEKLIKHLPVVYIQDSIIATMHSSSLENVDRVFFENQIIGCLAAKYFLNKRYKRIALINPYYRHAMHDERMSSFISTLHEHKIESSNYNLKKPQKELSPTYAETDELVDQMVQSGPLPEGLFISADIRAVHVYSALLSRGIKPMKDIDIITCNNMPFFTEQMNPKPAEIDIGLSKLGPIAIKLLQQRIAEGKGEAKTILIRPQLII